MRGDRRWSAAAAHREEVECAVEIGLAGRAQGEIRRGDRRREPTVEPPREAEAGMQPIPARSQRELMCAQLARVEQPVELDLGEAPTAERLEFLRTVLMHVPRVVRALGALRRQRQHVRCGHKHGSCWRERRAEVLEHGRRVVDMLDRLQEDNRLRRL